MSDIIECTGFHGTSETNAKSIIKENFTLSNGDDEWLGNGVYFFVKGLSDTPKKQAKDWAIAQAWNNNLKKLKYKKIAIIKSIIRVNEDNLLDLTTSEGLEVFEYFINRYEDKIRKIGKKLKYIDGLVINLAKGENIIPIEVVKGNVYIKFKNERIKKINRRIANSTIISVSLKNIISNELILVYEIDE